MIKVLLVFIVITIIIVNRIVKLKNNIKNSRSQIDVYLQQRFDLLPNLVDVVKGYAKYERETIEEIVRLKSEYTNKKDVKIADKLSNEYNNVMAIVEQYPELKASEHFLKLQGSLVKIESQLQAARRIYNNEVTRYNTFIGIFPINIFAYVFEFKEEKLFEI